MPQLKRLRMNSPGTARRLTPRASTFWPPEIKMAAFLLWNVHRKNLDALVHAMVRHYGIDVVLLVEYVLGASQLPGLLLADGLVRRTSAARFGVFVRSTHRLRRLPYRIGNRANIWKWQPPNGQEGLIALVHGYDRRNFDDGTRRVFFRRVVQAVERGELKAKHQRTIVAGDFNANPFESAVADSDGLHAIGVRAFQTLTSRKVRSGSAPTDFFYNPMWRAYGQQPRLDAGMATHYWVKEWVHELAWHMLDQVVLRPGETARFPEDQLRVITEIGAISLLDGNGLPDSTTASDHLPIVFHWNL